MNFPVDMSGFKPVVFDLNQEKLLPEQKEQLLKNIQIARDAIVFFTGYAGVKGVSGHTGGAYDIVPEALIADGFMRGKNNLIPILYDEAGHRVAIQYLMAAINGDIPYEKLLHYREYDSKLPGHPEKGMTPGIKFSSGRLGHMWPYLNGVALANPGKKVVMLGSDGSQQEGNNAEAARFAVANNINILLILDDNNVTIAGHPTDYMKGYDLEKTLKGYGLAANSGDGEDIDSLYGRIQKGLTANGPVALVIKRPMAPKIDGLEGKPKGHDVISFDVAKNYLEKQGQKEAAEMLKTVNVSKTKPVFRGSSEEKGKNRDDFGKVVNGILEKMNETERKEKVRVIDCDLEGSCGLHHIRKSFPEIYISGGIMERGNISAAAGFGSAPGRQGIFGTFSAFMEMVVSEIMMARLNDSNLLAHFSHAGVDDMADNTCHFGTSIFYGDNGFEKSDSSRLYFPADYNQLNAVLEQVFFDPGIRFVFSTRSAVPRILTEDGKQFFSKDTGYEFTPCKDEVIREGSDGYIISYGEMLYRALDAVERLKTEKNLNVGLINKPTLNIVDEDMMKKAGSSPFVLVAETQNYNSGLGIRFGTWLMERGLNPAYAHMGTASHGNGGTSEQIPFQGMSPEGLMEKVVSMINKSGDLF